MRSSIGLLLVPALVFGGCADDTDAYIPQVPVAPNVVEADEPLSDVLVRYGRRARANYERLRAAGFVQ